MRGLPPFFWMAAASLLRGAGWCVAKIDGGVLGVLGRLRKGAAWCETRATGGAS